MNKTCRGGPVRLLRRAAIAILALAAALSMMSSMIAAQPSLAGVIRPLSWGDNSQGALGIPLAFPLKKTPVSVVPARTGPCTAAGLATLTSYQAGAWNSLALVKKHGEVCDWGRDNHFELGHGTAPGASTRVPTVVCAPYSAPPTPAHPNCGALRQVSAISGGGFYGLAVLRSFPLKSGIVIHGAVVSWGDGVSGELGQGTPTPATAESTVLVPQLVCAASPAPYAAAKAGTPCPDNANSTSAEFLTGVRAVSGGEYTALALRANGTVVAWGDNTYCQLGIGNFCNYHRTSGPGPLRGPFLGPCASFTTPSTSPTNCSPIPVTVLTPSGGPLAGVTAISSGNSDEEALLKNGTVMTGGGDDRGQLGNGLPLPAGGPDSCFNNNTNLPFPAARPCGWFPAPVVSGIKPCGVPGGLLTGVTAISDGFPEGMALLKGGFVYDPLTGPQASTW
jgi:alpha-tubulin suppressor-like RCC1 family protein